MTKYTFKLNGVDVSRLVHKYGYHTERRPVYASRYTNLNGQTRSVVGRYRGYIAITTNDMTADDAAWLSALLLQAPLNVTYYSFQLKKEVTERMMVEGIPLALKMVSSQTDWVSGVTLEFEEE